jgi:hypothetical protein
MTGCSGTSCTPCPAGAAHQSAACGAGACTLACDPGYAACDTTMAGCTTNVSTDANNCGTCGHVCGSAHTTAVECVAGGDGGTSACSFTCSGAYQHCGSDDSKGCETDVGIDGSNCGACGHSCLGGQCVAGICQPVVLAGDPTKASGLKSLYSLATFNGSVYGTNWENAAGQVYKVPTMPGGALDWLVNAGGPASANFINTDGTDLVYSVFHVGEAQNAGIWKVAPDGTGNTLVVSGGMTGGGPACTLSTAYGYEVNGIAFDSSFIYWIRNTYGGCAISSCQCPGIYRANADGSGITLYFASTGYHYTNPVVDSGTLYFVEYETQTIKAATSTTFTMSSPPIALPSAGTPAGLATDANYVYWIDTTANKFYRIPKVAPTMATDITPMSGIPSVSLWNLFLVDAANIYFVSPAPAYNAANTQKIYRMPKDGSGPAAPIPGALVSASGDSASSMTQDSTALYWGTYGFDSSTAPFAAIYKLAK